MKNQSSGHVKGNDKEIADKVTGDKSRKNKSKGGKDGAVLADVNNDPKTDGE